MPRTIIAALVAIVALSSGSAQYKAPECLVESPVTIRDYAELGALETGIPAEWILAVTIHESGGDLKHAPARCSDGSVDLGPGFNSRWLSWYAKAFNAGKHFDPTSPYAVLIVARALRWNYDSLGTLELAATGYHKGRGWAKRHGVHRGYVAKVSAWL
jgi:hypothetical protein